MESRAFVAMDNLSKHSTNSQCLVYGNMSTATAFTGTIGSPTYCFEIGLAKSIKFLAAARGSQDMYINLDNFFALRIVSSAL